MSTINDIGIPGVGTGILQPKLKNKWRATFAGLGGGVDSQPISMQVVTFTRPKLSFDEVELHRYNSRAWIAGKHNWDAAQFTCEDDITGTATRVLQEQLQAQQWLIGAEGPWLGSAPEGSFYKFVTYLQMLDGKEQVLETWTYEGCWLQNVDYADVDYATSDKVVITVSMRFDHARQDIPGYSGGEGVALGGAGRITAG
jgi:hypothetical protein